jgi:molybdopterin synthase catalytic subunit
MNIRVTIIDGPITPSAVPADSGISTTPARPPATAPPTVPAAPGARLTFEGLVRPDEDGRPILALDYQVYDPMATRQMESIARALLEELGLLSITILHSRGQVRPAQCSLRIDITARHRAEAITAMARFIDQLKRDVPIWKTPIFADIG